MDRGNMGFSWVLILAIAGILIIIFIGLIDSKNDRSARQSTSISQTTNKQKPAQRELGRVEVGRKISGLDGQSTKRDEGSVARPGEGRTIVDFDGMDVNKDKE